MKFKTRLKIAYDMCMKQLMTFRISIILFAVVLTLFGVIIYQYKASYNYRLTVEKGFSKPLDEVYYLLSDLNHISDDTYPMPDITKVEGISSLYKHQEAYLDNDCLQFLGEINSKQYQEDLGIGVIWLLAYDFDLYNIEIVEGKNPSELNWDDGIPLYLSEEYKGITTLGEHYRDVNTEGVVLFDYYVAGYFSSDSGIPSGNVTANNIEGIKSLEYGIVEMVPFYQLDGYFYLKDGYTIDEVIAQIQEEYAKSNSVATITNVDSAITFMEKNVNKSIRYLVIATILLTMTCIIVLLVIQIGNILTRGKEYGIWLICNATDRDILNILILQNFIRFVYAELIAVLGINLLTRLFLYGENFVKSEITKEISNKIIATNIYPAILVIGLFVAVTTVIIPALKLMHTKPVKLVRGEL